MRTTNIALLALLHSKAVKCVIKKKTSKRQFVRLWEVSASVTSIDWQMIHCVNINLHNLFDNIFVIQKRLEKVAIKLFFVYREGNVYKGDVGC